MYEPYLLLLLLLPARYEEYPKLKELIQRKDDHVMRNATPPFYLKVGKLGGGVEGMLFEGGRPCWRGGTGGWGGCIVTVTVDGPEAAQPH